MKNIFTSCLLLITLSAFSQEAGKVGELLKNEAKSAEMQNQRNNGFRTGDEKITDNNRNPITSKNPIRREKRNYRWNYNEGNSEVFLRIPQNGNYTVEIGNQMMSNSTGKFRFFDLQFGTLPISIYENNFLIYRTNLRLKSSMRLVLDFFPDYGLYLLGSYQTQNSAYGINEWDDIWNNPYGNSGNGGYFDTAMNSQEFSNFIAAVQRSTSFDKDRNAMIKTTARTTKFTAQQIYNLVKIMNFDTAKLDLAKTLYARCVDQRNYYVVLDAFDFDSNKRELNDYISNF